MNRKESDKIIFVLDAMLLERSLQFLFQIMDLGAPIILAITMKDILERKNLSIHVETLKRTWNRSDSSKCKKRTGNF